MADRFQCGLVLLAAGASRRMGRPKQLLPVNGRPLVRHVVETLAATSLSPFVVVLGAHAEEIRPALAGAPGHILFHAGWAEGLGSSLAAGTREALRLNPQLQGLIVALADQPGLTTAHLEQLRAAARPGGIAASDQGGVLGPPVLFAAEWFSSLLALGGDTGARALLEAHHAAVTPVPLPAAPDLDTPEDYARFTGRPA